MQLLSLYLCPQQPSLINHSIFLPWAQLLSILKALAFCTSFLLREWYQLVMRREKPLNFVCREWGWLHPLLLGSAL